VNRRRNVFPAMNAVARWAHNLGHVGPEAIPTLATKGTPVARAAHRHSSSARLIDDSINVLGLNKRISQPLALWVRVNLHYPWILDCAAQAANAEFFAWRQTANRPREDAIDTGAAQGDPHVAFDLEELLQHHGNQAMLFYLDPESGRKGYNVWCCLSLDMKAVIAICWRREWFRGRLIRYSISRPGKRRSGSGYLSFCIRHMLESASGKQWQWIGHCHRPPLGLRCLYQGCILLCLLSA